MSAPISPRETALKRLSHQLEALAALLHAPRPAAEGDERALAEFRDHISRAGKSVTHESTKIVMGLKAGVCFGVSVRERRICSMTASV